jgi:hypothetical protein
MASPLSPHLLKQVEKETFLTHIPSQG